jgi:hypothetical protein
MDAASVGMIELGSLIEMAAKSSRATALTF